MPPLRADDPRVRVRLRNGKVALVYPGELRVSSGSCGKGFLTLGAASPVIAPAAPQPPPMRDYRVAASNRPIGRWNVAVLRHLYALPADSPLPFIGDIAAALATDKHSVDGSWAALAACGAIRTVYGRPDGLFAGRAWWRVVVLAENGRVLRSPNAPEGVMP